MAKRQKAGKGEDIVKPAAPDASQAEPGGTVEPIGEVQAVSVSDLVGEVLVLPEVTDGALEAAKPEHLRQQAYGEETPDVEPAEDEEKPKKRGRKKKEAPSPEALQKAGSESANLLFAVSRMLGGEEWEPRPEEREGVSDAFARYYEATGTPDMPPGVALCVALGCYAGPRFFMPQTRKRAGGVVAWFKRTILGKPEVQIEAEAKEKPPEA